jgi:hypothetical protein
MTLHIDDKGKYFTDVISKEEMAVIIQTMTHRVEGQVHVRPGVRLKDEMNLPEKFLAVTEASVFSPGGDLLYRSHFMAINADQIVWVIPAQELSKGGEA